MINKAIISEIRKHAYIIKHDKNTIHAATDNCIIQLNKKEALQVDPYILDKDSKFTGNLLSIEEVAKVDDMTAKGKTVLFHADKISQVVNCASIDEARPILTLVKFETETIIATDSYKLRTAITSHGFTGEYPARALQVAIKATKYKKDNLVTVVQDENKNLVFFDAFGNVKISIPDKAKTDQYPNWQQLMPTEKGEAMMLPQFKQENNPYGRRNDLMVVFKEGKPYLFSGQYYETKCIKPLEGMFPKTFDRYMLNYRYLCEATAGMKNVTISFSGHTKPVMFLDANNDTCSIIMPIRSDKIETMIDSIVPF